MWGCRDPQGGHGGQNLLGLALMQVRAELIADVRTRIAAIGRLTPLEQRPAHAPALLPYSIPHSRKEDA